MHWADASLVDRKSETLSGVVARALGGLRSGPRRSVAVRFRVRVRLDDVVVYVPAFLSPRCEDDLFVGVIRMKCGDHALHGIVEQDRRDTGIGHLRFRFVQVRAAEEGFVLFDRLALVVEDCPAAGDPAWLDDGRAIGRERTCLGLRLALGFAAEAVAVA